MTTRGRRILAVVIFAAAVLGAVLLLPKSDSAAPLAEAKLFLADFTPLSKSVMDGGPGRYVEIIDFERKAFCDEEALRLKGQLPSSHGWVPGVGPGGRSAGMTLQNFGLSIIDRIRVKVPFLQRISPGDASFAEIIIAPEHHLPKYPPLGTGPISEGWTHATLIVNRPSGVEAPAPPDPAGVYVQTAAKASVVTR